jgi:hypothetical protein
VEIGKVFLRELQTGVGSQTEVSGGAYRFSELLPGIYEISIEAQGFSPQTRTGLRLEVGTALRSDFVLQIATRSESVTVEAASTVIHTESPELSHVVGSALVQSLPLNGRDYTSLIRLAPGVAPATAGQNPNNIDGNRPDHVAYYLDGLLNLRRRGHEPAVLPSLEAIQEFSVVTAGFGADQGRMPAAVSVALRGGTNEFHGSLFEFIRNNAWDARSFFDATPPVLKRNRFGGLLGGPLKRDRLFFLASYEALRSRESQTRLARVPTAAERAGQLTGTIRNPLTGAIFPNANIPPELIDPISRRLLQFVPLPNRAGQFNYVNSARAYDDVDLGLMRVDWNPSSVDQVSARAVFDFRSGGVPFRGGPLAGFGSRSRPTNQLYGVSWVRTISASATNELRLGFTRSVLRDESVNAGEDTAPSVGITGVTPGTGLSNIAIAGYATFGDVPALPSAWRDSVWSVTDNWMWVRGQHSLRFGGEWFESRYSELFGAFGMGQFVFTNSGSGNPFADFLLGLPTQTQRQIGQLNLHLASRWISGFVQDDWRVGRRVTLNLGLRYDLTVPPVERDNQWSNFMPELGRSVTAGTPGYPRSLLKTHYRDFSPRVGFAYRLTQDSSTVLRGSYGFFRGTDLQFTTYQALGATAYPFVNLQAYQTSAATRLTFAQPFPSSVNSINPTATVPSGYEYENPTPYSQNWNLSLAREFASDFGVEAAYVGNKGTHLSSALNLNQALRSAAGTVRPYPGFTRVIWISAGGNSNYHALQFSVRRRYRGGLAFRSSFTYSKAIDDLSFGSAARQPQNMRDLRAERGLAEFDRRKIWSTSVAYELPFGRGKRWNPSAGWARFLLEGWQTNAILHMYDGAPFTVTQTGNAQNGEPTRPDRIGSGELADPTVEQWFDVSAFRRVALNEFRFGNSGRNILTGPGKIALDASVIRRFALGESRRLEFRGEAFNLPNHANFGNPAAAIDQPAVGAISTADPGRVLQLGLKFLF